MKMIKRYAGILMMLTLLVGFTSCEDDEDIYDDLMGRTWVGDLWFGSDYNPIESGIRLDNNGLGIDYQVYDYDGRPAGDLPFRWWRKSRIYVLYTFFKIYHQTKFREQKL